MRASRDGAFSDDICHLNWSAYLFRSARHRSPRAIQTRLTISAARYAKLLTLYGGSGLGKTTAAVRAIVYRSMVHKEHNALAISGMSLSRMSVTARADVVEEVANFNGTVLLDDIDKGSKAEGVSSALLEIIEARENADELLTIITTNSTGRQLKTKLFSGYGDPIVNRIARGICINFDPVEVNEADEMQSIGNRIGENSPHLIGKRLGDGRIGT